MPKEHVAALIREISSASSERLRELWREKVGQTPHPELEPALMRPVLAYLVQERAYGGLKASTTSQLRAALESDNPRSRTVNEAKSRFQAGTRLIRAWKGKTHEVRLTLTGYEYEGKVFQSLSPIACLITGTRWSGPAFFGTRKGDQG